MFPKGTKSPNDHSYIKLLVQIVRTVRIFAFLLVPNKVSSNFDHTLDVEKKVLKCQIRKWNVLCIIFWCQIVWVLKCPFLALDNRSGAKLSCYPMLVSLGLLKKLSVVGEQMEIYFWNVQKDPLMLLLRCSIKLSEKKLVTPPRWRSKILFRNTNMTMSQLMC